MDQQTVLRSLLRMFKKQTKTINTLCSVHMEDFVDAPDGIGEVASDLMELILNLSEAPPGEGQLGHREYLRGLIDGGYTKEYITEDETLFFLLNWNQEHFFDLAMVVFDKMDEHSDEYFME